MEAGITINKCCYIPIDENDACFIAMEAGITKVITISKCCYITIIDEIDPCFIAMEAGITKIITAAHRAMKMVRVSLQWKRETLFDSFHFGWTNSPLCEQCAGRIVPGTNGLRDEQSEGQTVQGTNSPRNEQSKERRVRGTNSPRDEQSKGRTVQGTNIPRDEQSGDESSGDEMSPNRQSLRASIRVSFVIRHTFNLRYACCYDCGRLFGLLVGLFEKCRPFSAR